MDRDEIDVEFCFFALIGSTDAPFNSRSVHSYTVILGNLDQMETTGFGSPFSPLLGVSKSKGYVNLSIESCIKYFLHLPFS